MKYLKNWDNKTWLASNKYISSFHKSLKRYVKINKKTQILDIGCGRGNIISFLNKKYRLENRPIGLDIIKNHNIKKDIVFKKIDAIKYLKKNDKTFDLIIIKQTIHFFNHKNIFILLNLCKKNLNKDGMLLICSLNTKKNQIPSFKLMQKKLDQSLKKDEEIIFLIKKNLRKYKNFKFRFKVVIQRKYFIKMINNRFISCLITLSKKEISNGIKEIEQKFKSLIKFDDVLQCIIYKKIG